MFVNLPFAYKATVRTRKGQRPAEHFFRSAATFEIQEVSKADLRQAVRVALSKKAARRAGRTHDVVLACEDRLYRRVMIAGEPFRAAELETRFSTDSGFPFSRLDKELPSLPIFGREWPPRLSGFGRLRSMEEAAQEETWQLRGVSAIDEEARFAVAYLHYARSMLIVDGELYRRAPEPAWLYSPWGLAEYSPEPSWHAWLYALDDHEGLRRRSEFAASSPIAFDVEMEVCELPEPRPPELSIMAAAAINRVPQLLKAAGRRAKSNGPFASIVPELWEAYSSREIPAHDKAERLLAITYFIWDWCKQQITPRLARVHAQHSMVELLQRARAHLGRDPLFHRSLDDLSEEDLHAMEGV